MVLLLSSMWALYVWLVTYSGVNREVEGVMVPWFTKNDIVAEEVGSPALSGVQKKGNHMTGGLTTGEAIYREIVSGARGACWTLALDGMGVDCGEVRSEEAWQRMAWRLAMCHLEAASRKTYTCNPGESIRVCLSRLPENSEAFESYSLYRLHVEHLCIYIQDEQWQAATTDLVSELKSVSAASEQQLSHLTESMEKHGQGVESWMINAEEEMTKLRAQGAEALAVQMDLIAQIDIMKKGSKEVETATGQSLEMVKDIVLSSADATGLQNALLRSYDEAFGRVEKLHTLTLGLADVLIAVTGNVAELKATTLEAHRLHQSTTLSVERSLNDLQEATLATHGLQQLTASSIEQSLNDLEEIREIGQTLLLPAFRSVKNLVSKPLTTFAFVGRLLIGFLISRAPFLRKYTLLILVTSIVSPLFISETNPWEGNAVILKIVLMMAANFYGWILLLAVSLVCLRIGAIRYSQHFKWNAPCNSGNGNATKALDQEHSRLNKHVCEDIDDLKRLSRKEIQQLAKTCGVPANLKTSAIIHSLRAKSQYCEINAQ